MNARDFLVRGLLAGLLAGIATFGVAFAVGEPAVDAAIEIEESGGSTPPEHSHAPSSSQHPSHVGHDDARVVLAAGVDPSAAGLHAHGGEEETGFSRSTQKTWGLLTATVAVGVALGGVVALVAAGVAGRTGRLQLTGSTALVVTLGFVAFSLVPFLKYPAAPPAVGSGETIGERTGLYFAFLALSLVALVAAWWAARALSPRIGGYGAVLAGAAGYVVVVAVAALAMPAVNEIGSFPADVLWQFRVGSLLTVATLWGTLGVALTWLLRRLESANPTAA